MTTRPVFKAHLQVEVLPGEGVLVLSEDSPRALYGRTYELVAPLLDGTRDADAIVDALAGEVEPATVYYALALLEKKGYTTDGSKAMKTMTNDERRKMDQLIAKAWADDSFKARLVSNPAATLKAAGLDVATGLEVRVVENTDKVFHLVVPARPAELNDDELDKVAAGAAAFPTYCRA